MAAIYLDNAATTMIDPDVADVMRAAHAAGYLNPASQHQFGRRARATLDDARDEILDLLAAPANTQLILTSGGTEANNLAMLGLAGERPGQIIVSRIEHPSVIGAAERLQSRGFEIEWMPVRRGAVVDVDATIELITPDTRLVALMVGNHETGALQPVDTIAGYCQMIGVPMHVDAVQAIGKVPVDFGAMSISSLSLTPHKFHGPRGIGALFVKARQTIEPLLVGGSQQFGLRPGTEDVALTLGFATALKKAVSSLDQNQEHLQMIQSTFERLVLATIPNAVVHAASEPRLPHISNIAFPGANRQALMMTLDMAGVACATGSACTSGSSEPSPVLRAMGLESDVIEGSLRFSFSPSTTLSEINFAVDHISKSVNNLQP